jgi:hypothetical protein
MVISRPIPLLVALAVVAAACSSSPSSPSRPDFRTTVTLSPGESATIGAGASITFRGVLEDSRCPADAVCIRAGEGVIAVQVHTGGTGMDLQLKTDDDRSVAVGRFTLRLEQLMPYPLASKPTAPGDYRATIEVRATGH